MVSAEYLEFASILLNAATALLLFTVAMFLAIAPKVTLQRRALALLLAFIGFRLIGQAWPWANDDAVGLIGNPFFYFNRSVDLLVFGALLLFFAAYPRRLPLRSWHGAVLVLGAALWLAGTLAWLFDRSLLYTGWPETLGRTTLVFWLVWNPGYALVRAGLALSALVRTRDLPGRERWGAWLVVPLLVLDPFGFAGSTVFGYALDGLGVIPGLQAPFTTQWATIPGDCCDIVLALVGAQVVAFLALAAWAARQGRWLPAGFVGLGILFSALRILGADFVMVAWSLTTLGIIYALSRGGLGETAAPARAWYVLALASLLAAFFLTIGALVALAGDPLGFPLAILLGLVAGLAAASWSLPPELLPAMLAGAAPVDPGRVAMYRAALQTELDAGLAGAPLAAKLRPLRAQLGLSDREHAVLEHALRATHGSPHRLEPGSLFLGRYRIQRLLGRGGAGDVYLARDERLGREVAVKHLAGHLRKDPEALARFDRETRLAAALHHPHIVAVHDVETVGEDAYLVMEYVPGGTLAERLARGPLTEAQARALGRDVLDALAALHARGIVHRDVKPSNLLLTRDGRAKLGDFTVARETSGAETVGLAARGPVGTFAYMSPEQARGGVVGPASDLYAVGATLYHALTGKPPLAVEGLGEMEARLRILDAAPALPLPGVGEGTNAVLRRALAKDPGQRFEGAAAMARALGKRSVRAEDQQAPPHPDDVAGA